MEKTIEIKIDEALFNEAQNIYTKLGLSIDNAIKLFLNQSVLFKGLPLSLRLPESESSSVAEEENKSDEPENQRVLQSEISATLSEAQSAVSTSSTTEGKVSTTEGETPADEVETPISEATSTPAEETPDGEEEGDVPQKPTSIVDDEEENTEAPIHLFDGWNVDEKKEAVGK